MIPPLPNLPTSNNPTTDKAVRYGALGLVGIITTAFSAVVVHGYWVNPSYTIPDAVALTLGAVLTSAFVLLGVHSGDSVNQNGATTTRETIKETNPNGNGNGGTSA